MQFLAIGGKVMQFSNGCNPSSRGWVTQISRTVRFEEKSG